MVSQRESCLSPHPSLPPVPTLQDLAFMSGEQLPWLCSASPLSWADVSGLEPPFPNKSTGCAPGAKSRERWVSLSSPKGVHPRPHCSGNPSQHTWKLSLKKPQGCLLTGAKQAKIQRVNQLPLDLASVCPCFSRPGALPSA